MFKYNKVFVKLNNHGDYGWCMYTSRYSSTLKYNRQQTKLNST